MSKKLRTGKSAFTLVELLVVIGVIALLISMLLPALNKARQSAIRVQCASNIRQIGQGMFIYASENNGWFPKYFQFSTFLGYGGGGAGGVAWMGRKKEYGGGQLSPIIKNYKVFFDPAFHEQVTVTINPPGYMDMIFLGTDPNTPFTEYIFFNGNNKSNFGYDPTQFAGKISSKPGTVICVDRNVKLGNTWQLSPVDGYGMNYMAHKEGFNVMYADGHVDFLRVTQNNITGFKFVPANHHFPGGDVAYDRQ